MINTRFLLLDEAASDLPASLLVAAGAGPGLTFVVEEEGEVAIFSAIKEAGESGGEGRWQEWILWIGSRCSMAATAYPNAQKLDRCLIGVMSSL